MKISVIVPVYNTAQFLPHCIESILSQSFTDFELLLIDDGSTDGSGKICDAYAEKDNRIRVIHHKSNIGLWAARNTGQDAATGEYLWFPDGDDYFHKDIMKTMYEAINRISSNGMKYDLAMVGCKHTSDLDQDVAFVFEPSYIEKSLFDIWDSYLHPIRNFVVTSMWNKLFRKASVNDIRTGNYK
jgi:glycosyltransferase involved in cell wall biosynthesis